MKFFLTLFLLISFQNIYPQNADTLFNDISTFINTGGKIATAPLEFEDTDWINLGGTVILTGAAFFLDDELKESALKNRSSFNKHLFNIDRYYYIESAALITAGTYLYGFFSSDHKIRKLGIDLGEAAVYASSLNILVKYITGRERPADTNDNLSFQPFSRSPFRASFGSAHTTLAFAISSVMAQQSANFFWKTGWYTAAGLVGAARIYHNMHWFSDVILGAATGYFIGNFVTGESSDVKITFTPERVYFTIPI